MGNGVRVCLWVSVIWVGGLCMWVGLPYERGGARDAI